MQVFREIFETYGGDYAKTMARFMYNEKMYLKFLKMLFQDQNLEKLGNALKSEDIQAAFEAAHTLKGVTANLGLTPLYEKVSGVVELLRAGGGCESCAASYEEILDGYQRARELQGRLGEVCEHDV